VRDLHPLLPKRERERERGAYFSHRNKRDKILLRLSSLGVVVVVIVRRRQKECRISVGDGLVLSKDVLLKSVVSKQCTAALRCTALT